MASVDEIISKYESISILILIIVLTFWTLIVNSKTILTIESGHLLWRRSDNYFAAQHSISNIFISLFVVPIHIISILFSGWNNLFVISFLSYQRYLSMYQSLLLLVHQLINMSQYHPLNLSV